MSIASPEHVRPSHRVTRWILPHRSGYAQSKYVSEQVVRGATERHGLVAVIARPGVVSGDPRSGASNTKDAVSLLLCGLLREVRPRHTALLAPTPHGTAGAHATRRCWRPRHTTLLAPTPHGAAGYLLSPCTRHVTVMQPSCRPEPTPCNRHVTVM